MRQRRHDDPEHPSHDRWLVSYADFITLLFAFFVVMYAISTLNEGKYKVLSDALTAAFKHETIVPPALSPVVPLNRIAPAAIRASAKAGEIVRQQQEQKLRGLATELVRALGPLVQTGQVRLTETALGLAVEINASVLFAPAQATLQSDAIGALQSVADVLKTVDNGIEVQGHTDRLPISTAQYPSNWELATARASAVIRLFVAGGVPSQRLAAVGYADNRPVDPEDTPDARARNRRVTLLILANNANATPPATAPSSLPPPTIPPTATPPGAPAPVEVPPR
jgi:chemotaxis protein MotB